MTQFNDDTTEPHVALTPGTLVNHYRIVHRIGIGGMGVVYLAEDTKLNKQVALKFLGERYLSDSVARSRFTVEAQSAASLDHPNVVTIHELNEYKSCPFFVMQYIEGKTLGELLKGKILKIPEIIDLAIQICDGLQSAHYRNIVHRDIKPSNVLIDKLGRAKLVDFGIAKVKGAPNHTEKGITPGTHGYMSPEQIKDLELDGRSDLFSLGIVLYEMVTGRRPFSGDSISALCKSIEDDEPEPMARFKSNVTDPLQQIVTKLLEKDRDLRYQSAADVGADLKRIAANLPPTSKPRNKIKSVAKWVAVLVGVAALLFIIRWFIPGNVEISVPQRKQITFLGDVERCDLSPDGKLIAYVQSNSVGNRQIFVKDLSGGVPISVFEDLQIVGLRWSPDGAELLIGAINDSLNGVYVVHHMGGKPRRYPIYLSRNATLDWSPDGQRFAVHSSQEQKKIFILNKDTGEENNFILDGPFEWIRDLCWSPSGDVLLFRSKSAQGEGLWTVKTDGTDLKEIYEGELLSARWSIAGEAIYSLMRNDQGTDLIKLPMDVNKSEPKGEPELLLTGVRTNGQISISKDANKLAHLEEFHFSNLWRIERNESDAIEPLDVEQLTNSTYKIGYPVISPDKKYVAFTAPVGDDKQIFKMDLKGGEPEQITYTNGDIICPAWSPDGQEIAFVHIDDQTSIVAVTNVNGSGIKEFSESLSSKWLKWAPSEKIIYMRPGHRDFGLLDPVASEETLLLGEDTVGWAFFACPSSDLEQVAVYRNFPPTSTAKDSAGLWIINTQSSEKRFLKKGLTVNVGWSEDNKYIYFFTPTTDALYQINVLSSEVDTVVKFPMDGISNIDATSDGRTVVCNVNDWKSDVWLIENFDPNTD